MRWLWYFFEGGSLRLASGSQPQVRLELSTGLRN